MLLHSENSEIRKNVDGAKSNAKKQQDTLLNNV